MLLTPRDARPAAGIVTGTAKTTNSLVEFVGFGPPITHDWRA
ncbi:MAG: hypothetical protein R3C54_01580 [Parvularculaceae bacterium]